MADESQPDDRLETASEIRFHYQKSPSYRTIHADGAHGGVSPRGYVVVTFYNERNTIPRQGVRRVTDTDHGRDVGPEEITDTLEGVMRQLEATVFLDLNASREFYRWFGQKVSDLEEIVGLPDSERIGPRKGDSK